MSDLQEHDRRGSPWKWAASFIALVALYVLSVGPANLLNIDNPIINRILTLFYSPLEVITTSDTLVGRHLADYLYYYIEWWESITP